GIEPSSRYGPRLSQLGMNASELGFRGHVFERSIAPIPEKDVAIDAGHEQIGVAVIVEISDCGRHRVTGCGNAGLFGHVGEMTFAVISVEAIEELRTRLFERGKRGPVG